LAITSCTLIFEPEPIQLDEMTELPPFSLTAYHRCCRHWTIAEEEKKNVVKKNLFLKNSFENINVFWKTLFRIYCVLESLI